MDKVKPDYQSLARMGAEALHEFEEGLRQKAVREAQERAAPKKKKSRRTRK